jgi:hypothetical protein
MFTQVNYRASTHSLSAMGRAFTAMAAVCKLIAAVAV